MWLDVLGFQLTLCTLPVRALCLLSAAVSWVADHVILIDQALLRAGGQMIIQLIRPSRRLLHGLCPQDGKLLICHSRNLLPNSYYFFGELLDEVELRLAVQFRTLHLLLLWLPMCLVRDGALWL